jgi:hypothetical protein
MKNHQSDLIFESILCANPKYELVLFDRLPHTQREMLKELRKDGDFYGILRPLDKTNLGVKSVSRDIALLFLTLQQPGRLPEYVRATLGERCDQEIKRLILDGVLALEQNGRFLSGSAAAELICVGEDESGSFSASGGFLERLSLEALRYGQTLRLTDRIALSMRLYGYNRIPLSPYWRRTLPHPDAVAEYLGIHGRKEEPLARDWSRVSQALEADGWLVWQSRRSSSVATFADRTKIGCKLYVSPRTECLREVFLPIVGMLGRRRARHFKVGKDASGLLRPDKMVAYFNSKEDLLETAEQLKRELTGCPAQGVPFTAELTDDGLLSWGIDPPPEEQALPWLIRESWRLWVTNRLAVALITSSTEDTANLEPWRFALRRLQLEGVDTRSWTPASVDWNRNFGAEN